mmetsp:Transcript_146262/g.364738  ORF Transcript_146262/g.364738 Transcript_146262/m.364738 type:complete len:111 (-) Transcript_146262:3970-4302(-)
MLRAGHVLPVSCHGHVAARAVRWVTAMRSGNSAREPYFHARLPSDHSAATLAVAALPIADNGTRISSRGQPCQRGTHLLVAKAKLLTSPAQVPDILWLEIRPLPIVQESP